MWWGMWYLSIGSYKTCIGWEVLVQGSKSYIFLGSMEDPGSRIWYKGKWHKATNYVTVCWRINRKLAAFLRVNEQDSRRETELGESHSIVDDGHKDYKSETHHAYMHMDEEDTYNIAEW